MAKPGKINVAILEDHQSTIDGYLYRINQDPNIAVVATACYGEEIEPMLADHVVDILLLGIQVPISADNTNPYPVLYVIPDLLQGYPELKILVVSMHLQPVVIELLVKAGVSGFIHKNDSDSIKQLPNILNMVARGGNYFSQKAYEQLRNRKSHVSDSDLSQRQIEVLSMCAAYPDSTSAEIAEMLGVADSTVRNLLSAAYVYLGVHTRSAAITKAQQLGLIPNNPPDLQFSTS